MRNYFAIDTCDVVKNLGPGGMRWNSFYFKTKEEAQAQLDSVAGDPQVVSVAGPSVIWFPLDKDQIISFLNTAANTGFPLSGTTLNQSQTGAAFIAKDGVNDTPRDGWTDGAGDKREPTPSDKQTASKTKTVAVETLLQALLTFAGALVAEGYKTGGRPNLLTKLLTFISLIKNNRPYDADALGVLLAQISSLAHFSG